MSLNVIAIMGRLVADPTMRQTQAGKNVASFRIACDRGRKDANGNTQADFIDIVAWERTADFVCKYFQKGSMIVIDGRLQTRNYQDKNGNNRTAYEVVASNVNFAGGKTTGAEQETRSQKPAGPANEKPAYSSGSNDAFSVIDDNEDLPF